MASKVAPFSPAQAKVAKAKKQRIPNAVFKAINDLLAENFSGKETITILQRDVVSRLNEEGFKNRDIYDNHWLDVELHYRKAGWKVEFDKPAYNETYDAKFIFTPKKK